MKTPNLRGIIFDMDGVLCDSEPFICEAAIRMFAERHDIEVSPADFVPFVGTGENSYLGGVANKYGVKLELDADKKFTYDTYLEIIRGRLKPMAGAREFISACRKSGLKLAVASSADRVKLEGNLREIGFPPSTFDTTVDGLEVDHRKPAPDLFQLAAQRLGLPCDQCLVIEDATSGIIAGKTAGCVCLGLTSTFGRVELCRAGADWTAGDLSCVPAPLLHLLT